MHRSAKARALAVLVGSVLAAAVIVGGVLVAGPVSESPRSLPQELSLRDQAHAAVNSTEWDKPTSAAAPLSLQASSDNGRSWTRLGSLPIAVNALRRGGAQAVNVLLRNTSTVPERIASISLATSGAAFTGSAHASARINDPRHELSGFLLMPGQQTHAEVDALAPARWPSGAPTSDGSIALSVQLARTSDPCRAATTDAGPAPSLPADRKLLGDIEGDVALDPVLLGKIKNDFGVAPNASMSFFTITPKADPGSEITRSWQNGMLPIVTLQTEKVGTQAKMIPANNQQAITSGAYDATLCGFFRDIAENHEPVVLRLDHEANTGSYPWGIHVLGNSADGYVAMWRHVHDIADFAGATNISWMWAPARIQQGSNEQVSVFYPGNRFVDVLGLDAYSTSPTGYMANVFAPTLKQLTAINPFLPIVVAEAGVSAGDAASDDGYRAAFFRHMFEYLDGYPQLRGLIYSDRNMDDRASGNYGLVPAPGTGAVVADRDAFRAGARSWHVRPMRLPRSETSRAASGDSR